MDFDDDGIHKARKIRRKMIIKANEWADKSMRRALRPLGSRGTRKKKSLFRSLRGRRGVSAGVRVHLND